MSVSVHLPEDLGARLAAEASRRGMSVDELSTELLAAGLPGGEEPDALEAFIGSGHSGRGDLAREHKQLRAEAFADKTARDV